MIGIGMEVSHLSNIVQCDFCRSNRRPDVSNARHVIRGRQSRASRRFRLPVAFHHRNTQHAAKERHDILTQWRRPTHQQSQLIQTERLFDFVKDKTIVKAVLQVSALEAFSLGCKARIKDLLFETTSRRDTILNLRVGTLHAT